MENDCQRISPAEERLCFLVRGWKKKSNLVRGIASMQSLLDLCNIVGRKRVKAEDLWMGQGELGAWDPKFFRLFND